MMLAKFRERYPQGSLVSELMQIDRGLYLVKVSVAVNNTVWVTAMAGANTIEAAEDAARARAIAALCLDNQKEYPSSGQTSNSQTDKKTVDAAPTSNSDLDSRAQTFKPQANKPHVNTTQINAAAAALEQTVPSYHPDQAAVKVTEPNKSSVKSGNGAASETAPTLIVEAPAPEPFDEPKIAKPPSEQPQPDQNSGNLFAGTSSSEPLQPDILTSDAAPTANPAPDRGDSGNNELGKSAEPVAIDFNEIKQKTDIEIKRLGWTKDDGREFLKSRYGKRSRLHLTDEQLLEFLHYLEKEPTLVN